MKFENTHVYNFEDALRGMRNSHNSWNRADSFCGLITANECYDTSGLTTVCDAWINHENIARRERGLEEYDHDMEDYNEYYDILEKYENWLVNEGVLRADCNYEDVYDVAFIGPNDLDLAQRLILAGSEHAKFMRQIFVSIDLTMPLSIWKQFDTYKVGTVANSTSTMHKLSAAPITKEMFAFDNLNIVVASGTAPHSDGWEFTFGDYVDDIVDICETLRLKFIETGDSRYWRALIEVLPSAYMQMRTVTMSYENLRNIYLQRRYHKMKEWGEFCDWIATLPYAHELIMLEDKNETN